MLTNLDKNSWDSKVAELSGSILQSWDWGEFQKSLGFEVIRLSSKTYINQVVEIPLMAGKSYLYSARGPLGDAKLAQSELSQFANTRSEIVFARIEPQTALDLPHAAKEVQPTNNWMLDLEQTEEQILAGMKPKTRYNINLAARKGVTVREGNKQDLLSVYKLLLETAGRNKFHLHPQNYYWQIWEKLPRERLRILVAESNGQMLACMLLTLFGTTATYLHGGSSSQMKEAMAPYILHWEAIRLAKNLGLRYYDFGGIAPLGAANHAWSGITRFKKSFGGFEVVYPGTYEIIYSPLWYNVYKQGRKLRNLIRK